MIELFPYEKIRDPQKVFMQTVQETINTKKHALINAPTGIGKTVASLTPSIDFLLKNKDYRIIFLTSRHTQHQIVIDTVQRFNEKNNLKIKITDIIGKKWMCLEQNINDLNSSDFFELCNNLRETNKCPFYSNLKKEKKLSKRAEYVIKQLLLTTASIENIISFCKDYELCPYEIAIELSKLSDILILDYFYLFNPLIRMNFLSKTKIDLSKTIIIVDEAHNLPSRLREILSSKLTTNMIKRAIQQVKKLNKKIEDQDIIPILSKIQDALNSLSNELILETKQKKLSFDSELIIKKEEFINLIADDLDQYQEITDKIHDASVIISKELKKSYLSSISSFLESWPEEGEGFIRYLSVKEKENNSELILSCLDPSILMKDLIDQVHSFILMSGTLDPTEMYRDVLGFDKEKTIMKTFQSPFPNTNRLNLIIPSVTSSYNERNENQYLKISKLCTEIIKNTPGNIAFFFPSYSFRDQIAKYLDEKEINKEILLEERKLTSEERSQLIRKFKTNSLKGSVLLAISSGSFSEGIDLPGKFLKTVVIVGLPLEKPSLEVNALIQYYDIKFNKGRLYGYIYPAMIKVIQAAGRCIRSETDKGAIIFLDKRYNWPMYRECFPKEWNIKTEHEEYVKELKNFFNN